MNDLIIHLIEFVLHYVAIGIPNILLVDSDICDGKFMLVCVFKTSGFFWLRVLFQKENFSLLSGAVSPRLIVTINEVLIHVNYSEGYENKQQRKIQSA